MQCRDERKDMPDRGLPLAVLEGMLLVVRGP